MSAARNKAWAVIRKFGAADEEFTASEVFAQYRANQGCGRTNLNAFMAGLARAGVLEVTATKRGKAAAYRLAVDPGPETPALKTDGSGLAEASAGNHARGPSQRALIWTAIRAFGQRRQMFTAWDVLVRVSGTQSASGLSSVRTYLSLLAAAGFLTRIRNGNVRHYRVARDTGPRHPVPREEAMYDPNTGAEHRREVAA